LTADECGALVRGCTVTKLEVLSDGLSDKLSEGLSERLSDALSDGLLLSVTVSGSGLPELCPAQPVTKASPTNQPTAARISPPPCLDHPR